MPENEFGQPIGHAVDFTPARLPPRTSLEGRYGIVEAFDPARHLDDLFEAISDDRDGSSWTYMGGGPFPTIEAFRTWVQATCLGSDPFFHAIIDRATGKAVGMAAYLRIEPKPGVIEIGHIHYSPRLQRSRVATEAMYLLMRRAFDELGYRRYEWKCDDLNAPSRRAALRYGFTYEGTFRQALVYKGRNRDTAWYAIVDHEWPAVKAAFEAWLDPANFDAEGKQIRSLTELRK